MAVALQDQLTQLESARQIVLKDPGLYPQIVSGILPIVGANARLELRRWGAEFLSETFSSPVFPPRQKEDSAVGVLGTLKDLLEIPGEDAAVVKSVVQTAASIYGLVFHYMYVRTQIPPCSQAS
jgi:symplekin